MKKNKNRKGKVLLWAIPTLTKVVIPDGVTEIDAFAFEYAEGLTNVLIPSSVTIIGGSAFYGCKGLTSVFIPDSVKEIANCAFSGTGLKCVEVPADAVLDDEAFDETTEIRRRARK